MPSLRALMKVTAQARRKTRLCGAAAVVVFAALSHAPAAAGSVPERDDFHTSLTRALRLIEEAHRGSKHAATLAVHEFQSILKTRPDSAIARVHYGVALVLQARDVPMLGKHALAAEGFTEMDAAVASAPDDPEVRLVRAINASQMPLLLGRREIAAGDFAWLIEHVSAPDFADASLRRRALHRAGSFALRERRPEAVSLLEAALSVPAATPGDEEVQSMLALARRELTPP